MTAKGQAFVDNGRFPLLAGSKIEVGHPEFLLLLEAHTKQD